MEAIDTSMTLALTQEERSTLRQREMTISQGRRIFLEVGKALLEIRDRRLFRETHASFDAYCQERWQFKRSRASQLIGAVRVVANLASDPANSILPINEGQSGFLSSLPPKQQSEVWRTAVENNAGMQPTRNQVIAARATMTGEINRSRRIEGAIITPAEVQNIVRQAIARTPSQETIFPLVSYDFCKRLSRDTFRVVIEIEGRKFAANMPTEYLQSAMEEGS